MKKTVISVALGAITLAANGALAGEADDVRARLAALENENAAIRKENAALRENKRLHGQNARLKSWQAGSAASVAAPVQGQSIKPGVFDALAADLPVAYKAPPIEAAGQFRIWAEGGAIWSGGDPVSRNFNLIDFTGLGAISGIGSIPRIFDLTPKVGWEAAIGFDYRFAGSPWHISGQFRYGKGGKTDGTASSAGTLDPAVLAALGGGVPVELVVSGSQTFATAYKENHWLADLAVGRDVIGRGRDVMQLKGGLRIAEFVTRSDTSSSTNIFYNSPVPFNFGGGLVNSISISLNDVTSTRTSFLGAGPMIGVQGSVPLTGNWSFDYLGDAAILLGTQRSTSTVTATAAISPAFVLAGAGGSITTTTAERFSSVFSGDIQAGISYWVHPNVKIGASYRLDALINIQNQSDPAVANITPNRYTHGPRLIVTGQF
jgi:hypothetical protein